MHSELKASARRQPLFSVTAADCKWSYTRGSGRGGQKRNKTSSAVHCAHEPSGARGYAEDTRSQHQNKVLAFTRMAESKEFQEWHRLEAMRRSGQMAKIDADVATSLQKIKVEIKHDGKWVEVDKNAQLSDEE